MKTKITIVLLLAIMFLPSASMGDLPFAGVFNPENPHKLKQKKRWEMRRAKRRQHTFKERQLKRLTRSQKKVKKLDETKKLIGQLTLSVTYKGKKRTSAWVAERHKKFRDKIIHVPNEVIDNNHPGGWYVNISECLLGDSFYTVSGLEVYNEGHYPIKAGSLSRISGATLLQNLRKGEYLIVNKGVVSHVCGAGSSLQEGVRFTSRNLLVSRGTFKYTTTLGATSTVNSYMVCSFLSVNAFAQLLNNGFELFEYKKVVVDKKGRKYEGNRAKYMMRFRKGCHWTIVKKRIL